MHFSDFYIDGKYTIYYNINVNIIFTIHDLFLQFMIIVI